MPFFSVFIVVWIKLGSFFVSIHYLESKRWIPWLYSYVSKTYESERDKGKS